MVSVPALIASSHFGTETRTDGHNWPRGLVGEKAIGLLALPTQWTPPFLIVTENARRNHADQEPPTGWLAALAEREGVSEALAELLRSPSLLVRSSAGEEVLRVRGQLKSFPVDGKLQALETTIATAWVTNWERLRDRELEGAGLALIIQPLLHGKRRGHASNERRVSVRHDSWLVEEVSPSDELLQSYRVAGNPRRIPPGGVSSFPCTDSSRLRDTIRDLAAATSLLRGRGRRHLEWLWDGRRVWVVQCDSDTTPQGEAPNARWRHEARREPEELSTFVEATTAAGDWQKTRCVRVFRECGMSTAKLYVLEDRDLLRKIMVGEVPASVLRDLRQLAAAPVVVRTDIRRDLPNQEALLLPRTATCMSVDAVESFIRTKSCDFERQGLAAGSFCFLVHRFLPAAAGSYSVGRPNVAKIRIDSTWGVPDGLLYLPHDSFEVNLADPAGMWRKLRCKVHYIDFESDGSWYEKTAGSPWDWEQSVSDEDLHTIAQQTSDLANHEKQAVEVMHFIDLPASTGLDRVIPWFFRPTQLPSSAPEDAPRVDPRRVWVRNLDDLARVEGQMQRDPQQVSGLALRADCAHVHSNDFVSEVARVAKVYRLPVDLEGSTLAHAYYILHEQEVRVRCIDAATPPTSSGTRKFDKLVRDSIPRIIEGGGERTIVERVEGEALQELLKIKVVEEAIELLKARTPVDIVQEAADVLEVIRTLGAQLGFAVSDILDAADEKRSQRGGFNDGVMLRGTYVTPVLDTAEPGQLFSGSVESVGLKAGHDEGIRVTRHLDAVGREAVAVLLSRVPSLSRRASVVDLTPYGGRGYLRIVPEIENVVVEFRLGRAPANDRQLSLFDEPPLTDELE